MSEVLPKKRGRSPNAATQILRNALPVTPSPVRGSIINKNRFK